MPNKYNAIDIKILDIWSKSCLYQTLEDMSRYHGGAWVYSVLPFSNKVTFYKFPSPSKVPSHFFEFSSNKISWNGKIRPFSDATITREQNRMIGRD